MTGHPLPDPRAISRVLVGVLAVIAGLVGAAALGLVSYLLLFAGVPWWLAGPALVGTVLLLALAGRWIQDARDRRAGGTRPPW
jgi:membrane protein implicated in regulation of membrane protease activity